jgi:hypothetical protein
MALLTQKNVGGNTVSSSSATLSETIDIRELTNPGIAYTTEALAASGLPNIIFRFSGRSLPPGEVPEGSYTITFEGAVRTIGGQPDFVEIVTIYAPSGSSAGGRAAPILYSFEFPCLAIRAVITRPSDQDDDWDNGYTYVLSAYGP